MNELLELWANIGIYVFLVLTITSASLYIVRSRLILQSKRTPLPPGQRGALSREEADKRKKDIKGPRINPEKATSYRKLTTQERYDRIKNIHTKNSSQEKTNTPKKDKEEGLPVFPVLPQEAIEFIEKNETSSETITKKGVKDQIEKNKTNFQKFVDKLVLENTRTFFERNAKGELNILAIESLLPTDNLLKEITSENKISQPSTESNHKLRKSKP